VYYVNVKINAEKIYLDISILFFFLSENRIMIKIRWQTTKYEEKIKSGRNLEIEAKINRGSNPISCPLIRD
jgi:hypothetical protein